MSENIKYQNSPLIEALCEFSFASLETSIEKIDTDFGSTLLDEFPERIEKPSLKIEFKQEGETPIQSNTGIIQYRNRDKNQMVQFGAHLLAINHLQPYDCWENFLKQILDTISNYKKLVGFEKITQIQLRFINRISVLELNSSISDYFKYSLVVPDGVTSNIANFKLNSEHFLNESRHAISISLFNTIPSQEASIDFIFDLNCFLVDSSKFEFEQIEKWLNDAHKSIYTIFDASLTEKCKKLFD